MVPGRKHVNAKDLEKYQRRIQNAKSKASRQAAEKYFEALRRELENAEGLEKVFDKHMTDRTGKYLVFCSNAEHMDAMIAKAPEWFSLIDPHPHVYRAYADAPSTSKAAAITYYRYLGEYENIVNERFEVIDETRDCKRLFEELERRLNCSWDLMYAEAKKYFERFGDLRVPVKYVTETGFPLGIWIFMMRQARADQRFSIVTEERIQRLRESSLSGTL